MKKSIDINDVLLNFETKIIRFQSLIFYFNPRTETLYTTTFYNTLLWVKITRGYTVLGLIKFRVADLYFLPSSFHMSLLAEDI